MSRKYIPDVLFKYLNGAHLKKVLCRGATPEVALKLSRPSEFNDAYDGWFAFKNPLDTSRLGWMVFDDQWKEGNMQAHYPGLTKEQAYPLRKARVTQEKLLMIEEKLKDKFEGDFGQAHILSLAESKKTAFPASTVMWGHYAKHTDSSTCEHGGFALGIKSSTNSFALTSQRAIGKTNLHSVSYGTERSFVDVIEFYVDPPGQVKRSLRTKSQEWAYESEWRMIVLETELGSNTDVIEQPEKFTLLKIPSSAISGIYMGMNSPPEDIAYAKDWIKRTGLKIPLFKMQRHPTLYEMTPKPLEV